ncbi:unnamed protein product, partial [Closterium sp. NIES-54]
KGEVPEVLIDWIRAARRQLSESFGSDLPVLRLHSVQGGEFSSDLLTAFCRVEGIHQTFTLPASPQQNGIAERRIGMVMDVARTSMIHAAAPHFLWPFAVQYAAHQINLQPRVSLPETTDTQRWTGKVGDASAFRVGGSRAFVRDTSADKLSSRAFYHPTSRRVLSSQDVTFDESVSYYHLFPYRTASLPPPPLFLAPGTPPLDPLPPQGPAPSGVSQVDPAEPVERVEPGGDESGGAESERAEPRGAEPGCVEPEGTASGGAEPARAECGGAPGVPSWREPLSPQQLHEWYSRRCRGAAGAGAAAAAGAAAGTGGAAGTGDPGAEGTGSVSAISGGAARPRAYYVPLLLGSSPSLGPPPPFLSPPPVQSQSQLQPTSPLPGPSPYSGPTRGLTERREPESRPVSPESRSALPVRTVRTGCVSRPRPPPIPGTHSMTLRPSTTPQRVPLPSPPVSSLPAGPDPASDSLCAASPAVTRFLATAVTDPLFECSAASALVIELVDFAAACRLDYATSLVTESASASVCPLSVGGESALGTDVLEDRQEKFECFAATVPHLVSMLLAPEGDPDAPDIPTLRSYAEAIEGPYSSLWQAAMDAEMASWKSTSTYVDELPPPGANIGDDFFQTFSPTPKMTTLRVLLHVAAHREYELHSLDFSTAFLQGSLHEEIWLRCPPGFTGSFPAGTQWSLWWPVYGLRQAPHDLVFATADTEALAHVKSELAQRTITLTQSDMVQQVLQCFGFTYSSPQSTPLPSGHSLSAPPSDESVEPSGPYPELVGCLITSGMGLVLGGRARVVLTGHAGASWVDNLAMQWSSHGYIFSVGSGSVSWRSTHSSSVLSSSCEAEIYAGAMAAQELRWLTYLLTDLGEAPRSPPVLYVDNKANSGLVSGAQTGAQNEAHCSALLPCSRAAAAWPASSCLRGLSCQHC